VTHLLHAALLFFSSSLLFRILYFSRCSCVFPGIPSLLLSIVGLERWFRDKYIVYLSMLCTLFLLIPRCNFYTINELVVTIIPLSCGFRRIALNMHPFLVDQSWGAWSPLHFTWNLKRPLRIYSLRCNSRSAYVCRVHMSQPIPYSYHFPHTHAHTHGTPIKLHRNFIRFFVSLRSDPLHATWSNSRERDVLCLEPGIGL